MMLKADGGFGQSRPGLRMLLWALLVLAAVAQSRPAEAQGYDTARWGPGADGMSVGICNTTRYLYSCFAVACDETGDLSFKFTFNTGDYERRPQTLFRVDRFNATYPFQSDRSGGLSMQVDPVAHRPALEALASGSQLVFSPGYQHYFSLRGSGRALEGLLARCEAGNVPDRTASNRVEALDAPPDGDETGLVWKNEFDQWKWFFNTDFPQNDLTSGFDDPSLKDVPEETCKARCVDLLSCRGYTYFRKTCILKSEMSRSKPFQGAQSVRLEKRAPPWPAPRLPHPDVQIAKGLARAETEAAYVAEVRRRAKRYGGACDAERAEMAAIAEGFSADIEQTATRAGTMLEVTWRGNDLTRALPMWFMVTSEAPVRFSGIGSYALGPDAMGPFGIPTDQARTRGITALYARGAGREGRIGLIPLTAGRPTVDLVLVGYLRACEETVAFSRKTVTLDITPDTPELVIHDEFDASAWEYEIALPDHNRLIWFNDDRVLLLDASDQSEVAEHAGQGLSLSPTGRFISLLAPDVVIDVIDGAVVAQHVEPDTARASWLRQDSFALSDTGPWGDIDLISLFHDGVNVQDQNTGPSCCRARDVNAIATVDLENNAVIVAGTLGHQVTALQNRNVSDGENAGSGYAIDGKVTDAALMRAVRSFAPVTDVALEPVWDSPIGPMVTRRIGTRVDQQGDRYQPDYARPLEARRLAAAPVQGDTITFRGLGRVQWQEPEPELRGVAADLARVGLTFAPSVEAVSKWDLPEENKDHRSYLKVAFSAPYEALRAEMRDDLAAHGFALNWELPKSDALQWDCNEWTAGEGITWSNTPSVGTFSSRFDAVHKLTSGRREIWILRAVCQAGATLGSLRQETYTAIFDSEQLSDMAPRDTVIDETLTMGNSGVDLMAEHPIIWRLYADRYLLGVSAEAGGVMLVDLQDFELRLKTGDLDRASLLADAALTEDLRHLVQINSDGSFSVYRLDGFARVLDGRIIDREVAVWISSYQFDATAEGGNYISTRFPGIAGEHALEQFDTALRVPGLVGKVLAGETIAPPPAIGLPPQLTGAFSAGEGTVDISYRMSSDPDGVTLHLYQDGLLTESFAAAGAEGAFQATRLSGARWVSLVAEDPDGFLSRPIGADLGDPPEATPLRLLSIGLDRYADAGLPPLGFAASDAGLVAEALAAGGNGRSTLADPRVLTDGAATRDTVLASVRDLVEGLSPGEHAVLFFAGHGLLAEDGGFHLAVADTRLSDVSGSALRFAEIAGIVAGARGRVTILLDACHSGAAGTGAFATNDDVLAGTPGKVPSNVLILSASRGREVSQESPDLGAGLFTRAVADVLQAPESHDDNANGQLELSEFYTSVRRLVTQRSGGAQNPWIARSRAVGDLGLF